VKEIRVVDSHTGGEPTRVVLAGGPDLGRGSYAERLRRFGADHDHYRSAIVNEPRGSDAMVGALLLEPDDERCVAGVVFFNNVGYLGMCGHGAIGLVTTLAYLRRIGPGCHTIETPVGLVSTELHTDGRVSVTNVPSYRFSKGVSVLVPGHGSVSGDVAWGGNWFFLVEEHGQTLSTASLEPLTEFAWRVRGALRAGGITGALGAEIDHVELLGPSPVKGLDSRNFVLCPGKAYDRSPCGTGTSAKLACLHGDGKLKPGEVWRQESVIGSVFEASFSLSPEDPRAIVPRITGRASITAETTLLLDERDPLCWGIRDGACGS
jgi:4-hydroxyproline epimerase